MQSIYDLPDFIKQIFRCVTSFYLCESYWSICLDVNISRLSPYFVLYVASDTIEE